LSFSYSDMDSMVHYKTHRIKTRKKDGRFAVEWQRDWQTIHQFEDHKAPNSWESTSFLFSTEENAIAFASLVLEGEIDKSGRKLGEDGSEFVALTSGRRTQPYYKKE
jgi:hypothetical protein